MANSNEKMRVLDLLEAGKITADDATQLLNALGGSRFMNKETRDGVEERLYQVANDVKKFAKDVGCKMQELYKDVEPKIKKASQSALEKAADALDTMACSISDSMEKCEDECCEGKECDSTPSDDEPKEN